MKKGLISAFLILVSLFGEAKIAGCAPLVTRASLISGAAYDDVGDLNSYFGNSGFPSLNELNYFAGFQYQSNFFPMLYPKPKDVFYSFEARFPFNRSAKRNGRSVKLTTESYSFDLLFFESYVKDFTIHPIIGLGLAKSHLAIISDDERTPIEGLDIETDAFGLSKITPLLNIGGGAVLRIQLKDDSVGVYNLALGMELRYLISLDFLSSAFGWRCGGEKTPNFPDYAPPGLSISFNIGIERQNWSLIQ